ncbi:hypothetical protein LUZ63_021635 [Rhynchospora breviuscula]|uniref:HTH lacI-type domain-containing protein n=1 Tax=Rhynchospora breviuscula TaxID=2022672 RepID=A0A9P9Z6A4_9POAL|nr:hypothetical protein LUZ63_021635 [Rhynchospora breviuscula]
MQENGRRPPSIRDVARLAGVSHQTVSRVLNDHPSIRPETRARVQAVMDDLSYRPNRAARMLSTSRSQTIGILAASSAEYGPATSIAAIEHAARERGYWVSTANIDPHEPASIEAGIAHLMAQSVEGTRGHRTPGARLPCPGVAEHRRALRHAAVGLRPSRPQPLVRPDRRRATGHASPDRPRAPGDLSPRRSAGLDRGRGAHARLHRRDHRARPPDDRPHPGDWTADFGYYAGRELLKVRDFTAVFASNDQMALGLLHAVRDEGSPSRATSASSVSTTSRRRATSGPR